MKIRNLILAVLAVVWMPTWAQTEGSSVAMSRISYSSVHKLCQQGSYTNVVDLQLEWPEWVDGLAVKPLQQFIAKTLFGVEADSRKAAVAGYLEKFGHPVTGQLKTIPDDSKFSYINCKLLETGYQQGRFISYRLSRTVEPGKNALLKGDTLNLLITYDLATGDVLQMSQVVSKSKLSRAYYSNRDVLAQVVKNASIDIPQNCEVEILAACLVGENRLLLDGNCVQVDYGDDDSPQSSVTFGVTPFSSWVSGSAAEWLYGSAAKKMLKRQPVMSAEALPAFNDSVEGKPVIMDCDTPPTFKGGTNGLREYLRQNIVYPKADGESGVGGRVLVTFTVDTTGQVRFPYVSRQVSPLIDSEAVRVVSLMPRWNPGMKDGKPANCLFSIPIAFHLHSGK